MKRTRKVLESELKQLKARMGAASGETRKNLRNRLARTTKELAEAQEQVKRASTELSHRDKRIDELVQENNELAEEVKKLKSSSPEQANA